MTAKTLALWAAMLASGAYMATAGTASAQTVEEPQAFAEAAASSNMFEIESSQLALEVSQNEDVRAFAEHMVEDHTAAGEKMMAAAEEDGVSPPAAMLDKHASQLEELQAAEGDAFDQAYIAAQTVAHDEAVALFEAFSTQGQESALRNFAAETLPTLVEHQEQVHELSGS